MRVNYFKISGLILFFLIALNGCNDSDVQKVIDDIQGKSSSSSSESSSSSVSSGANSSGNASSSAASVSSQQNTSSVDSSSSAASMILQTKWKYLADPEFDYQEGPLALGDDDSVYLVAGDNGGYLCREQPRIFSIRSDGTLKWRTKALNGCGVSGGPAVGPDGTVYIVTEKSLQAINPSNGEVKWEWNDTDTLANLAIGSDGSVFVANTSNITHGAHYYGISASGTLLWSNGIGYEYAHDLRIGHNNTLYLMQSKRVDSYHEMAALVAVDASSGNEIWSKKLRDGSISVSDKIVVLSGGDLLIASIDNTNQGYIAHISASSGNTVWRKNISADIINEPIVTPDAVYVIHVDGVGIQGYRVADGALLWTSPNDLLTGSDTPTAVDNMGNLYGTDSDDKHFESWVLNSQAQSVLRKAEIGFKPVVAADGTLYFGKGHPAQVIAVEGITGTTTADSWYRPLGGNHNSNNIELH